MAMIDICRLCAREDAFSKDLLLESNKSVRKMVQEFIQITVFEGDGLPTKICLNCEEKMVTFQLFVLECYKVQETWQNICANEASFVKRETDTNFSVIKSEVKEELLAEEIVRALNSEESLSDLVMFGAETDHHDYQDDDDDLDDVTIATLKEIKTNEHKILSELNVDKEALNKILASPNFKVKDIVKFDCIICKEKLKTWSNLQEHYKKRHKTEPLLLCMCGFEIKSKSVLYKHVSDHKVESKKLRKKLASCEDDKQEDTQYPNLNVKDFVKFTCSECGSECSSWYSLKAHCEDNHNLSPVVQCKCGITLKSKSVMYKHIHDHKNPHNILACDKCPKVAKSMSALVKHKMRHIPKEERQFCCSGCEKIFTTKEALKSHERSHIPIENRKIYHCDVCNMKFTTRSSAASHKKVVHERVKGYVCDLCGYACGTNGELRQHRAIHSDDKPFVCNKCSKSFKTYSNLKTHMDIHEDTAYECYICHRVLNSRRTLRKHLLVHEEKCRHVCSYCNKAFKRRQTLKVHMYTHTGDKPLTCKLCDERFAYASTLRSHRLRAHPEKMVTQLEYNTSYIEINHSYKNDVAAVSVSKNEVEVM